MLLLEKAFANAFGTREPASRLMKQYSKQSAAHGRKYCSVDERLKKGLCQGGDERDRLTKAEVFAIALYTGPQSLLCTHTQALRQGAGHEKLLAGPAGSDRTLNLYPNTIHALVSAALKLQRQAPPLHRVTLYRGLARPPANLSFPASDTEAAGFTEFGFMSTTRNKEMAVQYSRVTEGNPVATVLTIESGAVDRAASLGAFSQFPDEEEYLWTPLSYVEPEPEERQEIEMFARCGVVRIVPVRVNVNLKSQTIEEIQGQRKVILESVVNVQRDDLRAKLLQHVDFCGGKSEAVRAKEKHIDTHDRGKVEDVFTDLKKKFEVFSAARYKSHSRTHACMLQESVQPCMTRIYMHDRWWLRSTRDGKPSGSTTTTITEQQSSRPLRLRPPRSIPSTCSSRSRANKSEYT